MTTTFVPTIQARAGIYVRACKGIARMRLSQVLAYRGDLLLGLAAALLQIYLLRIVWISVYKHQEKLPAARTAVPLSTQLAYVTLSTMLFWLINPASYTSLQERVRDGNIAIDLLRPIGVLSQTLAGQIGTTVAMLPFALGALPVGMVLGGAKVPMSIAAGFAFVLSVVLGYVTAMLANTLVSLTVLWTIDSAGALMIYRMVGQFFSGALIPLWYMPGWLREIAEWTPFQLWAYAPLKIYLGADSHYIVEALLLGVAWLLVLSVAIHRSWKRASRRLVVQGG